MKPLFDDRKKAHEKQFRDGQELDFRAASHAVKDLCHWAAHQAAMNEAEAEAYQNEALEDFLSKPDIEAVLARILTDLQGRGVKVSRHRIHVVFEDAFEKARRIFWEKG